MARVHIYPVRSLRVVVQVAGRGAREREGRGRRSPTQEARRAGHGHSSRTAMHRLLAVALLLTGIHDRFYSQTFRDSPLFWLLFFFILYFLSTLETIPTSDYFSNYSFFFLFIATKPVTWQRAWTICESIETDTRLYRASHC